MGEYDKMFKVWMETRPKGRRKKDWFEVGQAQILKLQRERRLEGILKRKRRKK